LLQWIHRPSHVKVALFADSTIPTEIGMLENIRKSVRTSIGSVLADIFLLNITPLATIRWMTEEINFSDLDLTGPVPSEIGQLTRLSKFSWLLHCHRPSFVMRQLQLNLSFLGTELMDFGNNTLSGKIPFSFSNLRLCEFFGIAILSPIALLAVERYLT
jgi:hypothetical protein